MAHRSRFGFPYAEQLVQAIEARTSAVSLRPSGGIHAGMAPQSLPPGFSPNCYNFEFQDGYLQPRSGLSSYGGGASALSAPALGAAAVYNLQGEQRAIAASAQTISYFVEGAWQPLSYQAPASSATNLPSGTSRNYWSVAVAYEPLADRNIAVLTNDVNVPKVVTLTDSVATYSDLTGFTSLASSARAVCAFDNRLVWFNVTAEGTPYGQRVMWSPRGLPSNYMLADGAGFEDLLDMKGVGNAIVADRDSVLLFGSDEIWRGRKRLDVYAFDFYPIERHFGAPYPRTITRTPMGVIFWGADYEFYVVDGDRVVALTPAGETSRVQGLLQRELIAPERAWSLYNTSKRRYEFYYVAEGAEWPNRALYLSLQEGSWWPQRFAHEMSAGFELVDPGTAGPSWDELAADLTWDDWDIAWDAMGGAGTARHVHAISSAGSSYYFPSEQSSDAGRPIEALWDSHAMNREDAMRFDILREVWVEHVSRATSAMSVSVSFDGGASFADERALSTASGYGRSLVPFYGSGVAPTLRLRTIAGKAPRVARLEARFSEGGLYGA